MRRGKAMSRHCEETATKLQSSFVVEQRCNRVIRFSDRVASVRDDAEEERLSAGGQKVVGHIYQMQAAQPRLPTVSST